MFTIPGHEMKALSSEVPQDTLPTSTMNAWKAWPWGWIPSVVGLFLSFQASLFPSKSASDFVNLPLGLLGCFTLSVIVHELAHFFVGRWMGLPIWRLRIGNGSIVFDKEFATFRLVVGEIPFSGAVYEFYVLGNMRHHRWKRFLMVGAGPAANAVMVLAGALLTARTDLADLPLTSFPLLMCWVNACLVLFSLFPYRAKVDGAKTPNDGLMLIHLLLNKSFKTPEHSTSSGQRAARLSQASWRWIVRNSKPEPVLQHYRNYLNHPALPADARCQLLDAFATCVLMFGATDFLSEADRYSAELLEAKPDEWTVKGTRGSVLVDKGETEAGMAMLQEVMRHDPSEFDRAIGACFLALGEIKRKNLGAALESLRLARALDPNCGALPRLESLLNRQKLDG
jgi:hypothetical protein